MAVLQVQNALKLAGFDPGPLDGISGPRTRAAIRRFQAARGLVVDGIAGPKTLALLTGPAMAAPAIPATLPWLVEAARHLGLKEAPGSQDHPTILAWAKAAELAYDHDETPWCGLFMAHCIGTALPQADLPANPLGARQWLHFGVGVPPQLGAVLVFWRGSRDGWSGHVGLYWGEDASSYHVLGGNQSDAVTITRIEKTRLLGARWPDGLAAPGIVRSGSAARSLSGGEA